MSEPHVEGDTLVIDPDTKPGVYKVNYKGEDLLVDVNKDGTIVVYEVLEDSAKLYAVIESANLVKEEKKKEGEMDIEVDQSENRITAHLDKIVEKTPYIATLKDAYLVLRKEGDKITVKVIVKHE
ncbi:MAG: hypothetical protein ACTSR0_03950 [Candidatus Asgardarchaeia archaeon]